MLVDGGFLRAGFSGRYVSDGLAFASGLDGLIGRWMSLFLAELLFPGHGRWKGMVSFVCKHLEPSLPPSPPQRFACQNDGIY